MILWKTATTYLLRTLPRDIKVVLEVMAANKLQASAIFLGLLLLSVLVGLLVMGIATGNLPSVAANTDYWGPAVRRLTTASAGELPATLLETTSIYLDYPAVWFTFERMGFEEQSRTLAMDTTAVFPVITIRYLLESGPIAFLLTVYLLLSRRRAKAVRPVRRAKATQFLSISVPSGSSALGFTLAPMACCGGTAVYSAAYAVGFIAATPLAMLFSKLATVGVAVVLVIGTAWTARKINTTNACVSR